MAPKFTSMKRLLVVTAALEVATAVGLLAAPALLLQGLAGASLDTPGGLVMARVAGAALLSLGLACWLARNDGLSDAARALLAALLLYNASVAVVLANARIGMGLPGVGLWPTMLVHLVLAVWCIACILRIHRAGVTTQSNPQPQPNTRGP